MPVNCSLTLREEKELCGTLLVLAAEEVPVQLLDVGPSGVGMQEACLQSHQ